MRYMNRVNYNRLSGYLALVAAPIVPGYWMFMVKKLKAMYCYNLKNNSELSLVFRLSFNSKILHEKT